MDKPQLTDYNSTLILSLFVGLERDLMNLRTKKMLAAKRAQGVKLDKSEGQTQGTHRETRNTGLIRRQDC